MDMNEFKNALKNGAVSFSYTKKDGTVRDALGTLNEDLLPLKREYVTFKCEDIEWDIIEDEKNAELHKSMKVKIPEDKVNAANSSALDKLIGDELTDMTGYRVKSFHFTRLEKKLSKKMPIGNILYFDISKNGYRSFNESQLIGWKPV